MSLALPLTLEDALNAVQRRERLVRLHLAGRHALWIAAVTLPSLGGARLLGLLLIPLAPAATLAVVLGVILAAVWWWRQPAPTPLDVARTADRHAGLAGLLTTALTLPGHMPQPWEEALHARVHAQAREAAAILHPETLLPLPVARSWLWPAALVILAAALWWPAPLALNRTAGLLPTAVAVEEPSPAASATATIAPSPDTSAPVVNEPTPEPETSNLPVPGSGQPVAGGQATSTASSAKSALAPAGAVTPATGRSASQRPREARQGVTPGTARDSSADTAAQASRTRDTPFGSREAGQFQNESVTPAENLASAPYDPASAPGATPMQQKADPGTSALRAASGGRGIESEGADRCVQDCLTNNDMNRGAPPSTSRARPPGGETRSGTSDSGGGAAGSSSGVGLGVGHLTPIRSTTATDLGGSGVLGDRIQVLAAPEPAGAGMSQGGHAPVSAGTWQTAPELPTSTTDIPPDVRATVRTYFDRLTPARTAP
ncbi:hypothetical protein E7T09_05415 [Deinococcus sp. KSM4-11]|uniref:hypothetical protein n=1 Tax=Deinococcus sp. KSM4-11 TaxID=2568654 RepID=UPI0010A354EE|nr:hypothetical protein [Deinococcus sp. KSM4-11]THF88628.1 hypothetical protein E7T09_05415 [Deinococcus sp. KSM4-11]